MIGIIAEKVDSNGRELKNVLTLIIAFALLMNEGHTLETSKSALVIV